MPGNRPCYAKQFGYALSGMGSSCVAKAMGQCAHTGDVLDNSIVLGMLSATSIVRRNKIIKQRASVIAIVCKFDVVPYLFLSCCDAAQFHASAGSYA